MGTWAGRGEWWDERWGTVGLGAGRHAAPPAPKHPTGGGPRGVGVRRPPAALPAANSLPPLTGCKSRLSRRSAGLSCCQGVAPKGAGLAAAAAAWHRRLGTPPAPQPAGCGAALQAAICFALTRLRRPGWARRPGARWRRGEAPPGNGPCCQRQHSGGPSWWEAVALGGGGESGMIGAQDAPRFIGGGLGAQVPGAPPP